MSFGTADAIAAVAVLLLPLAVALWQRRSGTGVRGRTGREAFLTNAGDNGPGATFAGAIGGNVGIGSFLAIFAFTAAAPPLGLSLALAYAAGLVLCGWLAPCIRARARVVGSVGLADFITRAHGGAGWPVWGALAVVFILRSAVQLGALGVIAAEVLGGSGVLATAAVTGVLAFYLTLGGYRAAVGSDRAQAGVLVAGMLLAATGLSGAAAEASAREVLTLGPWQPALLVGIWLFLPFSAVLAVDNWQRITLAESDRVARWSYLGAAAICLGLFAVIAAAGFWSAAGQGMQETMAGLMPPGLGWVATVVLVVAIMSSVDTFVMPLVSSLRPRLSLPALRGLVLLLLALAAVAAIQMGDLLEQVVAAFNSLVVFLPACAGALLLPAPPRHAAAASMLSGLGAALAMTWRMPDSAALVGFAVALVVYGGALAAQRATRGTA